MSAVTSYTLTHTSAAVILIRPYRAGHEHSFYVQHHEPSSLVIAGLGFELVAVLVVDGTDTLMRMLAGPLAASRPLIRQEGPCVKMSAHA